MRSYAHRRYLAEYRSATDNEIAAENLVFGHAGKKPETAGYIPRVPLWLGRFSNRPRLTQSISTLARFAWWLTAGAPFHAITAMRLYAKMLFVDSTRKHLLMDAGTVGLALSRRALEVIAPPQIPAPAVWIVPPWVAAPASIHDRQHVSLLALVSAADLAGAVWLAMRFTLAYGRDRRRGNWVLQTYTAVPWLLTRIALSRVDADFIIAEHFDRWAVLADVTTRARRRSGQNQRKLTLVQHGNVGSLDAHDRRIRLHYRLSSVERLFVYDDASEATFRTEILVPKPAVDIEVHRFTPRISLTQLAPAGRTRILFVGHPLCVDLQIAVLNGLRSDEVITYYKPHPIAGLPAICEGRKWQIITERDIFPEVDILVAYRSTLVLEYKQHNIDAALHSLTNETAETAMVLQTLKASGKI